MDCRFVTVESLEIRTLLSAAFDLIGLTALRNDASFGTIDGGGVSIAVIDTGLDAAHPLLAPNFVAGVDLVSGGNSPTVVNPHGTHVAGIIGAKPDPARGFDGGVAPGVGLIGLNVFQQSAGGGLGADNRSIEAALQWVIDNRARYNIVAVNMSLGAGFYTSASQVQGDVYRDEIQTLENAGVTIVSAAGNSYGIFRDSRTGQQYDVQFPNSAAPGIVSTLNVGAVWDANEGSGYLWGNGSVDLTTGADRITSFSQRPPTTVGNAIFAPGAVITSTWPGNLLQQTQGTSQAAPMVAGAVALLQDAAQEFGGRLLSPAEVRSILQTTGDSIVDGDDEDDALFIDSNNNGLVDSGELFEMTNTGLSYARLNIYNALREVRALFGGDDTTPASDPNGTIGSAIFGPTLSGSPVNGIRGVLGTDGSRNIGATDVDMYQFTVSSPGILTIELSSDTAAPADFDSYLRLFDSTGTQLAADNNSGTGNFSQIKTTLGVGTYFVGVSGAGNTGYNPLTNAGTTPGATGNFVLGFSLRNDDPNGLISGAVAVNLASANEGPQVFNGFIGADFGKPVGVSDVDLFRIVVPDSGVLMVDVDTPTNSGYVDSFLRVFDAAGNALGFNNDAPATDASGAAVETSDGTFHYDAVLGHAVGHASDSFAIVNVTRGDVYYIGVSDAVNTSYDPNSLDGRTSGGAGGTYTISITFANSDLNGSIPQAATVTALPFTSNGVIGSDGGQEVGDRDVDIVKLRPTADGILEIRVSSFSLDNLSDRVDAVLKLFDGHGTLLAVSDDVGGPDPLLQISVPKNRDYFVGISGKGNASYDPFVLGSGSPGETGAYQVSARVRAASVAPSLRDDAIGDDAIRNITIGQRLIGNVGMDDGFVRGEGDLDLYRFIPTRSGPVEVRARTLSSFGADTFLRALDANGNVLASNDNSSEGTVDSRVQINVTAGQAYYFEVSGTARSTGDYSIELNGGFAKVSGGVLRIGGDEKGNSIRVVASSTRYRVFRDGASLSFDRSRVNGVSIDAGAGNDGITLVGNVLNATVDGGAGDDTLVGGDGNDVLIGNSGNDFLFGHAGNDTLYGNSGDDSLDGGAGNDSLRGSSGYDIYRGGPGNDLLFARDNSRDLIYGDTGSDRAEADDRDYLRGIERLLE